MKKTFSLIIVLFIYYSVVTAQNLYFPRSSFSDSVSLSKSLPALAQRVISIYKQESDKKTYLNNLFVLRMITGQYASTINIIDTLRVLYNKDNAKYPELLLIQYEIFCNSKLKEISSGLSFDEGFRLSFHNVFDKLDDKAALYISTAFITRNGTDELYQNLQMSLSKLTNDSINIYEALILCRNYNLFHVFKIIEPLALPLLAEETGKRYLIEDSVMIKTRYGASISALVARKKGITTARPSVLQFTIYASPFPNGLNRLLDPVANGYVSIVAYTRGKAHSPDEIIPYENDGKDAYDVIDWIIKQSWSNGKVGMFGGSYNGFTQWAAAKNLHPALKTIVPSASAAPGLDVPMTNNVFMSFVFPWIYYVTDNKYLDIDYYNQTAMWDSVNTKWYASGRPYNSLDTILGRGSKIFQRWLRHPAYDKYWQDMIPYKEDFAKINIPVLTTTGYYDGGQIGAMYYFREHLKYNKKALHYLIIGPFGHFGSQAYPDAVYNGYKIDPVANISIHDIIFQWFDYVLKDGRIPSILKDKINFEVMGANEWKHITTLSNMNNDVLKLYLNNRKSGTYSELSEQKPSGKEFLEEQVNFADRTSKNNYSRENKIIYDSLDTGNGIAFFSEPISEEISISGAFSGELKASVNKKDFDFNLVLYELMPDGKYFYLSYFMGRASYAKDISRRQLLKQGELQSIPFTNTYITCRKLIKGSRIVIVLNINKSPDEQINYGTGKDVSEESIKDAGTPLKVKWYNDSYVNIPVQR